MKFKSAAIGALLALSTALTAGAVENTWDYSVRVTSTVQASPATITLSWPQDTNGTPSNYTIFRKSPTDASWGAGTTIAGSATTYTDSSVTPGTAYEYRIVKAAGGYTGYGYILTGVNVSLVDTRGKVVLVVDQTIAGPLAAEITRLENDLAGDGWTVVRHDVSRTDTPANIKARIKSTYSADTANTKAVFLLGHVPVPYSGNLVPDGHPDHQGAWPADVFYGDMDGNWTDSSVNYTQSINTSPTDAARITNRPGDGKFDQTELPSAVELQVGRVDLANMPGRKTWGGPATFASEVELLRNYLNKDHNFRHRKSNPVRRAVLGDYFGARGGEAFAASGHRSFAPLVGPSNVRNLNSEYNDQKGVWIAQSASQEYLLAYGCGAGSYTSIAGLGNTGNYNDGATPELVSNNSGGVFNLLFGSWLGDWDTEDNILRAPLATSRGLVSAWSGRPHWFIHHLGLGETIGYSARQTQNNNGLYQTQINSSQYRIHVALMGDPTLRLHPVVPASNLNGAANGSTVALSWTGSSDSGIVGYHVYRRAGTNGAFTRLTSAPVTATNYTDGSASAGATYMVRAVKLESTPSGSYYNAAQGIFWTVGGSTGTNPTPTPAPADTSAPEVSISAPVAGATLSGSAVAVAANVTDNVGVTGVQFKLDGASLGAEVASAPFAVTLDSTKLANGTHTLSAVARDAAGNMSSATVVSVSVSNATTPPPTEPTPPPATTTPSTTVTAGTTLWFDDALPAGAGASASGGDGWNWVGTSPAPFSGSSAHKTNPGTGLREHSFNWAAPLQVSTGEVLVTYVYLDPASTPTTIMLSWNNGNWEHRAYWGANEINYGTNNTAGRRNMGALPAAGQWVRLEVPASAVGLEGSSVQGMSFAAFGGSVTWDATGKAATATTTSPTPTPVPTTPTTTTPTTTTPTSSTTTTDTVWFDDSLPSGAWGAGTGGDGWNWITSSPTPFSGAKAHQTNVAPGLHEHYFNGAGTPMTLAAGDKIFVYVYLDPANVPSELMLSFVADNWEHRAYWGANLINNGTNNTAGRFYAGALPAAGQWVRLEVSAAAVGLEGQSVKGMSFSLFNGRATWDKVGKAVVTSSSSTTTPTTTTPVTTTPATGTEFVWVDDALPAGAWGAGSGGDTWNWVSNAVSGTKAHQSAIAAGLHEHYFNWASSKLTLAAGDVIYTYVYLDPANLPQTLMLSFGADNWEHRVYWGANNINYGNAGTPGRYYAGALPAAGQWVRLEVPASAVGLVGQSVHAMSFSLYGGRATFDKTGKISPAQ